MQTKKIIITEFAYYGMEANLTQVEMWAEELKNYAPEEIEAAYKKIRSISSTSKINMALIITIRFQWF